MSSNILATSVDAVILSATLNAPNDLGVVSLDSSDWVTGTGDDDADDDDVGMTVSLLEDFRGGDTIRLRRDALDLFDSFGLSADEDLTFDAFASDSLPVDFVEDFGCDESERFSFGILNAAFLLLLSPLGAESAFQLLPLNALSEIDLGVEGAEGFAFTSFFVDSRRFAIGAGFGVKFCTDDGAVAAVAGVLAFGLVIGCVVVVTRMLSVEVEEAVAGVDEELDVELTHSRLFSSSRL